MRGRLLWEPTLHETPPPPPPKKKKKKKSGLSHWRTSGEGRGKERKKKESEGEWTGEIERKDYGEGWWAQKKTPASWLQQSKNARGRAGASTPQKVLGKRKRGLGQAQCVPLLNINLSTNLTWINIQVATNKVWLEDARGARCTSVLTPRRAYGDRNSGKVRGQLLWEPTPNQRNRRFGTDSSTEVVGGGGGGTKNIDAVLLHPPQWERAQEEKKTTKLQSDTAELLMNKTGQLGQEQQGWRQSQTGEASRADASQRVPWEVRM